MKNSQIKTFRGGNMCSEWEIPYFQITIQMSEQSRQEQGSGARNKRQCGTQYPAGVDRKELRNTKREQVRGTVW